MSNESISRRGPATPKLSKIYYSTEGYWKGYSAINKLAGKAKVSENVAKQWLQKQAIWQIYLPAPKYIPRPHWTVDKPNNIHQADLLFLPHDKVGRKTYKYALVVVDVASRYKDSEPLTSKESHEVSKAFEKIYSRKMKYPKTLMVDPGREFMGDVTKLMNYHNVKIQRSEAGNHRAQAFVENANRILGERLFSHQYAQEMISDERSAEGGEGFRFAGRALPESARSRVWVKRLPDILKTLNNTPTKITGKEPDKAIKLKEVDIEPKNYQRAVGLDEVRILPGVKVRYLLSPGELEGGEKRRATDPIWSIKVYDISRSVISPNQPVLYYLQDGPRRGFVMEEIQVVPFDTELPPNSVLERA